jgi:hypothetical protein
VPFIRSGFGEALLAASVLSFGCGSSVTSGGNGGAAGQSSAQGGHGGHGGHGGAVAAQTGGAGQSSTVDAGAGGEMAGSTGDGEEPATSGGGTGHAGKDGSGGTNSTAGSGGHATGGSTAIGGSSGQDECAWNPASTDQCPVCDAATGCSRPGYKYIGSGAITSSCCGFEWQEEASPGTHTWSEAVEYCASLSLLGGGWRLPKIAELFSLVDLSDESHTTPAINVEAFADTVREPYWSSSLDGKSGTTAWCVNFSDGASQSKDADEKHRVRCVR